MAYNFALGGKDDEQLLLELSKDNFGDHRAGTSKYGLPRRKGPFQIHLAPHKYRRSSHNLYNEIMQRLIVRDFAVHARYLRELVEVRDFYLS